MRKFAVVPWMMMVLFVAPAASAQVRVLASNGVRAALEALKPQVEKAAGQTLAIEYGSTAGLRRKIEAGEAFDMAIITPQATADLTKSGQIASGSAVDFARTGVGFGIKAGAANADVSTPDAVKQMLLKAKSISIVKEGASRVTIDKMFDTLGIAAAVGPKTKLEAGTEQSGESVAQGQAEVEIVPLSEIPLVHGVQTLGPLPGALQEYLRFQASVSANAKDAAAAKKAIQFLTGPAAAPVLKAHGMEAK
jgi:molybdate transport system substrate-binding protein